MVLKKACRGVNNFKNFVKDFETFFGILRFFSRFWDIFWGFGIFPGILGFFWDFFGKIFEILGLFLGFRDFFWDFGTFFGILKKNLSKIFSSCLPLGVKLQHPP